ncbi:MAG: hypothetical protein HC916_04415 [Coleofasciculaceae cyanobacterium SM2_1_6]|nr:hypothetical protein [Coleofasciculaceae cyanobacterium SM2_1_6]
MPINNSFATAIKRVVGMTHDPELRDRVRKLGLNVVNVMWEDTARTPGSCWGPNITDMTLQIRHLDRANQTELLPVIRYPNFTDKTGDVPLELIKIKVGNEKGEEPQVVTLQEYLTNLSQYISYPTKFHNENQPLLTEKDTHVLVSAQACFLPIPQAGKCSFNPVLFNYQSRRESPAVLAILISTEGSSATVLDNTHDVATWGQNIYFNHNGQKTCLTGERLSDYKENQAQEIAEQQGVTLEEARSQVTVAQDVNMVIVVQVPLKQKELEYPRRFMNSSFGATAGNSSVFRQRVHCALTLNEESDMEDAVIGHGEEEGEHLELGGCKLERDDRYPLRLTVQFYKATSNGIIDDQDLENISQCIEAAYTSAEYIGSLVVGTLEKGNLGMGEARPTQPAPAPEAVLAPPKDFLEVVNPFAPHHQPKAGE